MRTALVSNPAIASADAQAAAARANARVALGSFGPQASAGMNWSREVEDATPRVTRTPKSQTVDIRQPLTLGSEWASWSAARAEAEAAEANARSTAQSTLLNVASAYTGTLLAAAEISQTDALLVALTAREKAAQTRFKYGEDTATDVADAQARLASALADKATAAAGLQSQQAKLENLLGQGVSASALVWPQPRVVSLTNVSTTLENHPQVQAARALWVAQKRGVTEAIMRFLPEVNASAGYTRFEDSGNPFQPAETRTVGLNLSIPLFTSGQNTNNLLAARARARSAGHDATTAVRSVYEGFIAASGDAQATKLAYTAAQKALEAQTRATKGARQEYIGGERSLLDLLDAEEALRRAHLSSARAHQQAILAALRLEAALGTLAP